MKKGIRKKAFTLTELLVVVVVIGVLSAVVLPKFSKVIETRRTTEAEELMASVRTEQERRCALDKKYITGDITRLNDIVKNPKNYTLELANAGIKATRKNGKYNYTLEMPSYADGRICCDDTACQELNKNYPTCNELRGKEDYQISPESCVGEKVVPPTPPTPPCNDCSCPEYAASHADECNSDPGPDSCTDCSCPEYAAANPTECTEPKPCTDPKPTDKQPCNDCGEKTREVTCNTIAGVWETGAWSTCSKTKEECTEEEDCCSDSFTGDFAACLAKKHGYSSPEYICAKGSLGIGSGAWNCTAALGLGSGQGIDYALFNCKRNLSIKDEKDDSSYQYCKSWQDVNNTWLTKDFKRYACNGKVPVSPSSSSASGSSSEEKTYTCTFRTSATKTEKGCISMGLVGECQAPGACWYKGYSEGQNITYRPWEPLPSCTYCTTSPTGSGPSCPFSGISYVTVHKLECVED